MSEPLVYGHSEVARFAEPSADELQQMLRDGKGRPAVIRFLAQKYWESSWAANSLQTSYPQGSWNKP